MARLVTLLLEISAIGSIASGQYARSNFGTIALTDAQKLDIVRLHNDLRRSLHSSNMRYMTWDGELAWMAESYGRKCRYRHNRNRRHSKYASVGENMYASTMKAESFKPAFAMQKWSSEEPYFNYYSRSCQPGQVCGHYTQVVWATSFKVGCALTTCAYLSEIKFRNSILFICNYATSGNIVTGPEKKLITVYKKGYPCSECKESDYCRDLLCANSKRDFVMPPDNTEEDLYLGFIIAVVVLSLIVVALVAWTVFRECRARLSQIRCCWKGKFQEASRRTNGTSKSSKSCSEAEKSIPLISRKPSILEVTDFTGTGPPVTRLSQQSDQDLEPQNPIRRKPRTLEITPFTGTGDPATRLSLEFGQKPEVSSKRESRASLPKPTHPAPRSPPPSFPAPVLARM